MTRIGLLSDTHGLLDKRVLEHFRDVLTVGHADAALAATLFHFGEMEIGALKDYLAGEGIPVRRVKEAHAHGV